MNDNRSSVNNCVYERISAANEATDAPLSGPDAYKIRADLPTPPWPYTIQNCPKATIVPLTDSIKDFEANGTTAGQLGAAWAWNLISSKWKDIWPTDSKPADENGDTDKIVILMTDGVYNTIGGVNWGDNSTEAAKAREMSVDLCTGMKNAGITVYTVGFMLNNADATKTLKDCAGKKGADPTLFFFEAENGTALDTAFKSIASNIMKLRLTN